MKPITCHCKVHAWPPEMDLTTAQRPSVMLKAIQGARLKLCCGLQTRLSVPWWWH